MDQEPTIFCYTTPLGFCEDTDLDPSERRVTLWHKTERRKISGNAAPKKKNLDLYLRQHPHIEIYTGQDNMDMKQTPVASGTSNQSYESDGRRVTLWHRLEKRKVSGNAAPLEKNLHLYLAQHPEMEVFTGQSHQHAQHQQQGRSQDNTSQLGTAWRSTQQPTNNQEPRLTGKSPKQQHQKKHQNSSSESTIATVVHRDPTMFTASIVAVCSLQPHSTASPVSVVNSQVFLTFDASLDRHASPFIHVLDP